MKKITIGDKMVKKLTFFYYTKYLIVINLPESDDIVISVKN